MTARDRPIGVVIVDDEPLARASIRAGLERHPDVTILGEAEDGHTAVRTLRELEPEGVFLDVRMPGLDGFDVLEALGSHGPDAVVFVTAYDDRAVDAFDVRAVDYLMKPFDDDRFDDAVRRLRDRIVAADGEPDAPPAGDTGLPGTSRLVVREGERVRFVELDTIRYLSADGHHVVLHREEETHRVRATLTGILQRLGPGRFCRIHRSTVVNLDRLRELRPYGSGDWLAILDDGTSLRVSRHYRESLMSRGI